MTLRWMMVLMVIWAAVWAIRRWRSNDSNLQPSRPSQRG
jgi:hypothetical protein